MRSTAVLLTLLAAASCICVSATDGQAHTTGVNTGLCVVVGAKPASELIALTNGGRMLVECLVAERTAADQLRSEIDQAGQLGMVTIKHQPQGRPLPYVDTFVNLLIADGAIDAAEVARVVTPYGATVLQGKVAKIPLPATMDEWPQTHKDASQSAWSTDQLVGPPTGFRWISPMIDVSVQGGKTPMRVVGGRVFTYIYHSDGKTYLEARDACNGTQRWLVPAEFHSNDVLCGYLVANQDSVYTYLDRTGPLSCLDARTGQVLRTLDCGPKREPIGGKPQGNAQLRKEWDERKVANAISMKFAQVILVDQRVLVSRDGNLTAFDEASGTLQWTKDFPNLRGMRISTGHGRVYLIQEPTGMDLGGHRGTENGLGVGAVLALDLATGRELWRRGADLNEGTAMTFMPPQIYRDRLVLSMKRTTYPGAKLGTQNSTLPKGWTFASLDPATGATIWRESTKDSGGSIDAGIMWIAGTWINDQGILWTGYVNRATGIDTANGTLVANHPVHGNHCFHARGIGKWFTAGYAWVDTTTGATTQFGSVRPDCNDASYGVYGGVLCSTSNCECMKYVQGRVMMTSGPLPTPVPDTERLESFSPLVPRAEVAGGWRALMGDAERSGRISGSLPREPKSAWSANLAKPLPGGPLPIDWSNDATMPPLTPPVVGDGMVVVARGQQHTLIAVDPATGSVRWSTVLGGRIDSPPTLWRGHAYAGCRDGYVYAIDLADGAIRWRHLVASDRRQMVNASQLESLWPVMGTTVMHKGALYASGGITSQHDGGIWVACIDPITGASRWRSRALSPGSGTNSVRHEPLVVRDGTVWMDKLTFDPDNGTALDVAADLLAKHNAGKKQRGGSKDVVKVPDDRIAVATSGNTSWFGWPTEAVQFPGFSGMQMTMMMPGARTIHRGGSIGHWTSDTAGHYRCGSGQYQRKFGDGKIVNLTAWATGDAAAGMTGKKASTQPIWTVDTKSTVGMAMDTEVISVIESGNGQSGTLYFRPTTPSYTLYKRSDGTVVGTKVTLPGQVVWRGLAATDGALYLSFEDGSLACWK